MSKSIFIRNPKCATISIRGVIKRHKLSRVDELTYHQTAQQWKSNISDFNDHHVFSVCRNPYDRLLSGWLFICRRNLDKHQDILKKYKGNFQNFIMNLEKDFQMKLTDVDMVTWSQKTWLFDDGGSLLVDDIGRYENLASWWASLCQKQGWPSVELPRSNTTKHGPWKEYYCPDTIKVVNEQYADDFKLLNYKML